ncbi:MAG: hypothetical protein HW420_262 [Candidatus Nitrosotenuis sp.]|nr:hypothetical protein [Candidatus Nitrosotenuis sp.]
MIWPGMGDPAKRKKTLKFLALTATIGISVGVVSIFVQQWFHMDDPLRVCINNVEMNYKITATLELYVDKEKIMIPSNIGNNENCRHSLYTLSNDGIIHAEWKEKYPFEIGHFLWAWTTFHENGFPIRDMDQEKSKIYVNGQESKDFVHASLVDGYHYRAEFFTKTYDKSTEHDFAPPK